MKIPHFTYAAITALIAATSGLTSLPAHADQVTADDLIVQGDLCVGTACVDGEVFGSGLTEQLKIKGGGVGIVFDDTGGSSTNNWALKANATNEDSFFIEDLTGGTVPFKVIGTAPDNSLFVAADGRVGFGTSIPQDDLHIVSPFPSLLFEATAGTPQRWRVGGNSTRFFIEDSTSFSNAFLIFTGAPESSLVISSDGDIGLGTSAPEEKLHIKTTANNTDAFALFDAAGSGSDAAFLLRQNGTVPTTWEFRNQQSSGRLNVGVVGGTKPFKIDNLAATNLLRLGLNGEPNVVSVTGELRVNNTQLNVPDYVFADDYALRPLADVRAFIDTNSHLPEVPSAAQVAQDGLNMTEMQMVLLKKVEELTLYTLEQEARALEQEARIARLEAALNATR